MHQATKVYFSKQRLYLFHLWNAWRHPGVECQTSLKGWLDQAITNQWLEEPIVKQDLSTQHLHEMFVKSCREHNLKEEIVLLWSAYERAYTIISNWNCLNPALRLINNSKDYGCRAPSTGLCCSIKRVDGKRRELKLKQSPFFAFSTWNCGWGELGTRLTWVHLCWQGSNQREMASNTNGICKARQNLELQKIISKLRFFFKSPGNE